MGDERRSDGNGAVVAIVVVLGIFMLMGLIVVVGAGFFFFAFETRSVTIAMPVPVTSTAPASSQGTLPDDPEPADLQPLVAPEPPIVRVTIKAAEAIDFRGENSTLAEFKTWLAELKERTPNQELQLVTANDDPEFIDAVKKACAELEIKFTISE